MKIDKQEQLNRLIDRMVLDNRLRPVHMALSLALCHNWSLNQFQHSYRVTRNTLMKASRIRSTATYHKALRDLQAYGYVKYVPSYHPRQASEVVLLDETKSES